MNPKNMRRIITLMFLIRALAASAYTKANFSSASQVPSSLIYRQITTTVLLIIRD